MPRQDYLLAKDLEGKKMVSHGGSGCAVVAWQQQQNQVSALHELALVHLSSCFLQKTRYGIQSSPAVVYSSIKQGFAKAVSLF